MDISLSFWWSGFMWVYQKTLQHPVNIKNRDLKMAKYLITQFGGPNGELAASLIFESKIYYAYR